MTKKQTCANYVYGGQPYRIGHYGTIGVINGNANAGKSTMLTPLITSALNAREFEGWYFDIKGEVYHINTEDSEFILEESKAQILEHTDKENVDKYHLFNITDLDSPEKKFKKVLEIIDDAEDYSLVLLDILSDVSKDINDISSANNIISKLASKVKAKNLILIVCNHLNNAGTTKGFIGKRFYEKASFGWLLTLDTSLGVTYCIPIKRKFGYLPEFGFYVNGGGYYKQTIYNPFPPQNEA